MRIIGDADPRERGRQPVVTHPVWSAQAAARSGRGVG